MGGRLEDRTAIVVGAGSAGPGWGNGKATAVTFARAGARVLCVDIDRAAAAETAAIIVGEGGTAEAQRADVTDKAQVDALVARAVDLWGGVDVLHNNVGIVETGGPVETEEASWDRVMAVNLKSMYLTCKAVLPVMEAAGKVRSSTSARSRASAGSACPISPMRPASRRSSDSPAPLHCSTRPRASGPTSSCPG